MTYATMTHSQAVSYTFLDHILGIFKDQVTNIKLGLEYKAILTLIDFMGTPVNELANIEWQDDDDKTHTMT